MEKETLEPKGNPISISYSLFLSLTFSLFSFSPPLPLDLVGARTGQAAAGRPGRDWAAAGQAGVGSDVGEWVPPFLFSQKFIF